MVDISNRGRNLIDRQSFVFLDWNIALFQMKGKWLMVLFAFFIPVFLVEAYERSPLYVNLQEFPLYVKTGFNHADTLWTQEPSADGGWKLVSVNPANPVPILIKNLDLGGPARVFLSPNGAQEREYTFIIPFIMGDEAMDGLDGDNTLIPGINLVGLGDNWEIYLNGFLIKSEMHLNENGRIMSHRNYHNIYFPVHKSLFNRGNNVLALRIVGDPSFKDVGLFYAAPYEINAYSAILRQNDETVTLALIGIYLFMGIYHLFMYFVRKKEPHNLFYGLFSALLGIYYLVRTNAVYTFIPDRLIMLKTEFFCVFLILPLGAMFLENLCLKRTVLFTKIYGGVFALLAVAQLFFSLPFAIDTLTIWSVGVIITAPFILIYDVGYMFFLSARNLKEQYAGQEKRISGPVLFLRVLAETPIGNLLAGALICLLTGRFDVLDSLVFHYGVSLTRYGFFIFTAGTAFVLARRFASLYSQQQRIILRSNKGMNAKLVDWIVVQDRDPYEMPSVTENSAIMFTDVRSFTTLSEGMSSQSLTDFLGALNEILAKPLFEFEDHGCVAYTDKFIGDGTMNIFTDVSIALKVAIETRAQLETFNKNPRSFFKEAPANLRVNVGIGIAYGLVTLGIMGHSRRVDYTPIGDTVNLASRLEGLTKEYGASILLNDALYGAITNPDSFHLRQIDRIRVKGREHPVNIYEEFSADSPALREANLQFLPEFKELQEMYFSGKDWEKAIAIGEELIGHLSETLSNQKIEGPGDYLPSIYVNRMKILLENPEHFAQWDGVYSFDRK
jgi:class 3 adenylate cyclase